MKKRRNRPSAFKTYFLYGLVITVLLMIIVSTVGRSHFNVPQKFGMDVVGKGQYVVTRIVGGIGNVWNSYIALIHVRRENKVLRDELDRAIYTNQEYREAMAENIRLHKLLQIKETHKPPTLTAQIIGRDPSLWFRTLTIDRGTSDGIEKGMPVITVEGVVGQILETSRSTSKVLLAHDPNSAVNALVQKNRVQGIVKGEGSQSYNMLYILKNADVEEGDLIVTSGLGGSFPKGIPVGTVSSVTKTKRGMFQNITVTPSVNFSQLEYLIVILQQDSLTD
ncbi:MAG: rod shape-determining protein MreC [Proteobacteria bacterium]|nr:rod shape-determining protein MreC [Pseudomonadota bacterium]MBU1639112.1 rod shape-determining protein MreC [Pseudomonadota bacterium]